MSETKQGQGWTPGPWVATTGFVRAERGGAICTMSRRDENGSGSVLRWAAGTGTIEDGANARLIAAAPELVSFVIQYLYSEHGICAPEDEAAPYSPEELLEMARAALARAKGRE